MTDLMAYCGLICHACPIYLATRLVDPREQAEKRAEIAALCRTQYGMDYRPQDIGDCDGCRSEWGRLFVACASCPIHECARGKGLESCAECPEYACARLETFLKTNPEARDRLDEQRRVN